MNIFKEKIECRKKGVLKKNSPSKWAMETAENIMESRWAKQILESIGQEIDHDYDEDINNLSEEEVAEAIDGLADLFSDIGNEDEEDNMSKLDDLLMKKLEREELAESFVKTKKRRGRHIHGDNFTPPPKAVNKLEGKSSKDIGKIKGKFVSAFQKGLSRGGIIVHALSRKRM